MPSGFNEATLNAIKEVMGDSFSDVVNNYIETSEQYVSTIVEGEKSNDFRAIEDAAHPLKSSSATIGAVGLSEVSAEIESLSSLPQRDTTQELKLGQLICSLPSSFKCVEEYLKNVLGNDIQNPVLTGVGGLKILHIDDESIIRKVTGRILMNAGFEVLSFDSVENALKNLGDYTPEMILVDFMMPDMEGMQSLLNFKADHRLAEVPVIFVTGLSEDKVMQSLQGYIEGYIPKPYKPDELVTYVKDLYKKVS
ncbi:MAG: response regulator [Alphaproteobacteria bacterium]